MFHMFKKKTEDSTRVILATQSGEAFPLSAINDPAFAALGDGVCVLPTDGKVYAPVDGKVAAVAETGHALGIVSDDGAEFLIHIGVDTVELQGQGFKLHVTAGQTVKAGALLCEADLDLIRKSGFQPHTAVLLTNVDEFEVEEIFAGEVRAGKDKLFSFRKK